VISTLGSVSEEETKNWASVIAAQSRLKLVHFGQSTPTGPSRDGTHIVFENDRLAYYVWILAELNTILLDVFHKSGETDEQIFRGEITLRSLERISRILTHRSHEATTSSRDRQHSFR
jgi:hypothetical protein